MDPVIDPFRTLLLNIANDCTDDDFTNMKFLCNGCVSEGRLEAIKTTQQLFTELIHDCHLASDKKQYLASLLFNIGRHDLKNRLLGKEDPAVMIGSQNWGGLPLKVPNFVDRKDEVKLVVSKLTNSPCQVVTITGPPGFGKSAVAIQAGHDLCCQNGVSVYYITLRNCTSLVCMANALLRALRMVSSERESPLKQAMHVLCNMTADTVIILDNAEDMLIESMREDFSNYVENVAKTAPFVRVLVTSRMSMTFLDVDSFQLSLDALQSEDAQEILKRSGAKLVHEDAETLASLCGGVPLVLHTTSSLLAKKSINPKALIMEFQKSPSTAYKAFNYIKLSHDHQIFYCLSICFDRLSSELQQALLSLSVFPTAFEVEDAQVVLKEHSEFQLAIHLQELVDNSLLQYDNLAKQYSIHGVVQAFCRDKAMSEEHKEVFEMAKKDFNCHYLDILKVLHNNFVSKKVTSVVQRFLVKRRLIRQALLDSVKDPDLEITCIDTANYVAPFLAKVFRKEKCLQIFEIYTNICKQKNDKKRYSDCLTAEAYCILSHCACHLPCPSAVARFKEAHAIQTKIGDESSVIRAHCLTKLGRCISHYGEFDKGIKLVKRGIAIREKQKDDIQLAVGYKDLAVCYSFNKQHKTANRLRHEKVLPVYQEYLGDHPYTATLMDDMGVSYMAMSDYSNAYTYIKEALRMRIKALGNHQETARSYHDYGTVLVAQEKYYDALSAFREGLKIQESILGIHDETIRSHQEISNVLKRMGRLEEALEESKIVSDLKSQAIENED